MTTNEIITKIETLNEMENFINELKAEAEALKDSLKEEMNLRDIETMEIGQYVVRYTSTLSSRFDTKRFKQTFGEEVYNAYTKQVSTKRFSIA